MKRQVEAVIPTQWGIFKMLAYANTPVEQMPHIVMMHEACDVNEAVVVRIHSECITGDLFTSQRCDCGEQLERAMELAAKHKGAVVYLRQEGRGIGLINKLKAYNLQDTGLNTIDANTHLGFEPDERQYEVAIQIFKDLGIDKIHLLTNNPLKIGAIEASGVKVCSRMPIIIEAHSINKSYLDTKKNLMGHLLSSLD